jgi:alkylhydroperoxidase family enzyme
MPPRSAAAKGSSASSRTTSTRTSRRARHAYKVVDADIDRLRDAGYTEDAIFELTLAAALGAAQARLEAGLAAMG